MAAMVLAGWQGCAPLSLPASSRFQSAVEVAETDAEGPELTDGATVVDGSAETITDTVLDQNIVDQVENIQFDVKNTDVETVADNVDEENTDDEIVADIIDEKTTGAETVTEIVSDADIDGETITDTVSQFDLADEDVADSVSEVDIVAETVADVVSETNTIDGTDSDSVFEIETVAETVADTVSEAGTVAETIADTVSPTDSTGEIETNVAETATELPPDSAAETAADAGCSDPAKTGPLCDQCTKPGKVAPDCDLCGPSWVAAAEQATGVCAPDFVVWGIAPDSPTFTVTATTAKDNATGIMWQRIGSPGGLTWLQAKAFCTKATTGGFSNWHLPSITELDSLIDLTTVSPSANKSVFTDMFPSYYWSSSLVQGQQTEAWTVQFVEGALLFDNIESGFFVRCAR